ncbi:MAG: AMP-binding protein [Desulfobacterales bacterium]|nr:MAG: AMP-binding protein [Desulfobacterales bacterium]
MAMYLERAARVFASTPFVIYEDQTVSFEQMNSLANRIANSFLEMGVIKGDRVIIFMENCLEWLYTWFGLSKIGAIAVPINTSHRGPVLAHMIDTADAKVMVAEKGYVEYVKNSHFQQKKLHTLIVCCDDEQPADLMLEKIPYRNLLSGSPSAPDCKINPYDPMAIMYTSGTTGMSKGVLQPNNQYVWCGQNVADSLDMRPGDIFYCWFPLFHIVGAGVILMSCLVSGSAMALVKRFSLSTFWSDISKYNATLTGGFAVMIELLYKQAPQPKDADNCLRRIVVGHPPKSIHRAFEKRFNVTITDEYGMTEIEPISCCSPKDRHSRPGTCGRPVKDVEVKIFDENDRELAADEVGEIVLRPKRSHIMMQKYYNAPHETVDAWRNLWFHTGDFGYLDADGYLYFVDRKKDCIRRRGENISSHEVESIINTHPKVLECAAVGIPSDLGDEDLKVVLRLKPGMSLAPAEVLEFCQDKMAYFMIPRYVEFIDEFPRTETSKILKRDLKTVSEATWDRDKAGFKLKT